MKKNYGRRMTMEESMNLTIEEKKTREMFTRARHNLRHSIWSEKEAIRCSPTGFACGWEWHKPFHEKELAAVQKKYEILMTQGYV